MTGTHRRITVAGRTQTLAAWGREVGLDRQTIANRLAKGAPPDTAVANPKRAGLQRRTDSHLTIADVLAIREAVAGGHSHSAVARRFGVGRYAVRSIVSGATWKDVGGPRVASRSTGAYAIGHIAEARVWRGMVARVTHPQNRGYANYGGRGIGICARWMPPGPHGFKNFLADMGPRPEGTSLDRIDVDGDYEPANCRWADAHTQATNKRGDKALRDVPRLRSRIAALEAEVAALRASVARVERRQRGEDPRQLRLVEST